MPSAEASEASGARAWARRWWRALVAELLATALLVLLGVASLLPDAAQRAAPLAHPAFAFGFVVLVNVEAFGPASGAHMNPSVTLAALLTGRLPAAAAAAYALAQLLGALLGAGALLLLAPGFAGGHGVTQPGSVGPGAACAVEALLTGALALLCCALWTAHEAGARDPALSVKFGLAVAGLVFAGGAMTGASLNPMRSFAPALLQSKFDHHWVYWVGPLGGAALAALLHRWVLTPRARPPAAEGLPLADKREH